MSHILVFTGSAGPGIATAAAAAALRAARQGSATLLLSLGSARALAALLGAEVGGAPAPAAPNLDALAIDGLADLAAAWERERARLPAQLAHVAGDELPLPPGAEILFGLLRLRELAPRYDVVVVEAGPHDTLLRALALPDGLRWAVRLLFGLDRGPGKSAASMARAALPTSFLPSDALNNVQDLRLEAERLRALLTGPHNRAGAVSSARYVLRPDRLALEEARLAIPALQLHGLAVPAIVAGPLLPAALDGTPFAAQQHAVLAGARAAWPARMLLSFTLPDGDFGMASLDTTGAQLGAGDRVAPMAAPIAEEWDGAPALAIELPGLPKHALQLTLSGDELIVRVGPYHRHILLPERMRGVKNIKATREGERLIVRRRDS
jgi:anion-transporting  ArsA/GET3 family ATPase